MKRVVYFYKILFACLFFLYIFPSCNDSSNSNQQKPERDSSSNVKNLVEPLSTVDISIIDYNQTDQSLDLRINGSNARHVRTNRNAKIKWTTTGRGNNIDIVEIAPDPDYDNSPDFFSEGPSQDNNPKHWKARVNPSLDDNEFYVEKYYIKWKIENTSTPIYNFDPLMQVNPIKIAPTEDTTHQ